MWTWDSLVFGSGATYTVPLLPEVWGLLRDLCLDWGGWGWRISAHGHALKPIKCVSVSGLNKELIKLQCSHLMDVMLPLKLERILMTWENVHYVTWGKKSGPWHVPHGGDDRGEAVTCKCWLPLCPHNIPEVQLRDAFISLTFASLQLPDLLQGTSVANKWIE